MEAMSSPLTAEIAAVKKEFDRKTEEERKKEGERKTEEERKKEESS